MNLLRPTIMLALVLAVGVTSAVAQTGEDRNLFETAGEKQTIKDFELIE